MSFITRKHWNSLRKLITLTALSLVIVGCTAVIQHEFNVNYGDPSPQQRTAPTAVGIVEYQRDVEPIIESRCLVCHGCYDAPCQLKMDAFAGIERGAHKDKVYDGKRLLAANMTRLFEDGNTTEEWRAQNFYPVLNERMQNSKANIDGSVLYQMLALKRDQPLPATDILPDSFDFKLNRNQQCPSIEEFDTFKKDYPLWGMPYGLPALKDDEFITIERWIKGGAKNAVIPPLNDEYQTLINHWETFLNGNSLKEQLVSRYIYEHLFVGHIYFDAMPEGEYFKLRRSATPPGQPIQLISTRRPYDDPKVDRVYYRLERVDASIVAKSHMPYRLNGARMRRWKELFFSTNYTVDSLPSYSAEVAANPFDAFSQLPANARYRFMLDEARFTIMGFIKGPVCRGQIALNVIQDRFWVMFTKPINEDQSLLSAFLKKQKDLLRLPTEKESTVLSPTAWSTYSKLHKQYLQEKQKIIEKKFPSRSSISLDLIWDGDGGTNKNAALTIFRHFDSATVVNGFIGDAPKTAWLIGYPLLERIHYLLVAGYDVYGNTGHQLVTRLYMDFLRMEGEYNFLLLLPENNADLELENWYRGAESQLTEYLENLDDWKTANPNIDYKTSNPKLELFDKLFTKFGKGVASKDSLNWNGSTNESRKRNDPLHQLANVNGQTVSWLPEVSFMRLVEDDGKEKVYTLIADRAHTNISHLLNENQRIIDEEQQLTLVEGIIGDYPNAFFHVEKSELNQFVAQISRLGSQDDYQKLLGRFGIRRTNKGFWEYSDWLAAYYKEIQPIESGILDYNRFENK